MFISNYFPVVLVRADSLVIRDLVLSDNIENLFLQIQENAIGFDDKHIAKKIFLRDFFVATLLSGHLDCHEDDLVLVDISNDSFLGKKGGVYRARVSHLVNRISKITLEDWQREATRLMSSLTLLDSIVPENKTTLIEAEQWPKIIQKSQIFIELRWKFQEAFIDSCLPYLNEKLKN